MPPHVAQISCNNVIKIFVENYAFELDRKTYCFIYIHTCCTWVVHRYIGDFMSFINHLSQNSQNSGNSLVTTGGNHRYINELVHTAAMLQPTHYSNNNETLVTTKQNFYMVGYALWTMIAMATLHVLHMTGEFV